MNTGAISMRYARALLMFSNDAGVAPQVYQEALTLLKSFQKVPELKSALEKPVMTRENKSRILIQAAGGDPKQALMNQMLAQGMTVLLRMPPFRIRSITHMDSSRSPDFAVTLMPLCRVPETLPEP